jgi:hypothetical protein
VSWLRVGAVIAVLVGTGAALYAYVSTRYGHLHGPRGVEHAFEAAAAKHPGIVEVVRIGASAEGRPIVAARVSRAAAGANVPSIVFQGSLRGGDRLVPELALAIVDRLASARDVTTRALLERRVVWVIAMPNPDGTLHDLRTGPDVRWDLSRGDVDLAANFPWATEATEPRLAIRAGAAAFSEPETRALRDFFSAREINALVVLGEGDAARVVGPYAEVVAAAPPSNETAQLARVARTAAGALGRPYVAPAAADEPNPAIRSEIDWAFTTLHVLAIELHEKTPARRWPTRDEIEAAAARLWPACLALTRATGGPS